MMELLKMNLGKYPQCCVANLRENGRHKGTNIPNVNILKILISSTNERMQNPA